MKSLPTPLLLTVLGLFAIVAPLSAQQDFWQPSTGPYGRGPDAGMTTLRITSFATGPSGTLFAGDETGLHRSRDAGVTWDPVVWEDSLFTGKFESLAVLRDGSPSGIVFARLASRIYRSTDDGLTWLGQPVVIDEDTRHSVIAGPDGYVYTTGRIQNTGGTLVRSINGGVTWQPGAFFDADNPVLAVDSIGGIAMSDGRGSIYFSSNNGTRWGLVASGINPRSLAFNRLGQLLVATNGRFYRAERRSPEDWRLDSISSVPLSIVTTVSVGRNGVIYLAGDGIYRSLDNGRTWTDISSGLPVRGIGAMGHHRDGWIFAGTLGGSVVRSTVPDSGLGVSRVRTATSRLEVVRFAARPNPISERGSIGFTLGSAGIVRLDLLSTTGSRVGTLLDGVSLAAGDHDVDLDTGLLPAGVYFCRLSIDGQSSFVRIDIR